jgi:hypothetical protein
MSDKNMGIVFPSDHDKTYISNLVPTVVAAHFNCDLSKPPNTHIPTLRKSYLQLKNNGTQIPKAIKNKQP